MRGMLMGGGKEAVLSNSYRRLADVEEAKTSDVVELSGLDN